MRHAPFRRTVAASLAGLLALAPLGCKTPGSSGGGGSSLLGDGWGWIAVCTGPRPFFPGPVMQGQSFDFRAKDLSLVNAYWLAAASAHAYANKDLVLGELKRLGFKDSPDPASPDHTFFLDEDGIARNVLRTGLDFKYADTQAFWAESKDGVVLAFRGTEPDDVGDIVADIWVQSVELSKGGVEAIGNAAVAADDSGIAGADAPPPAGASEDTSKIYVHKGFWRALDIVWPHLEKRAKELRAQEAPVERTAKEAVLDRLADKLAAGDSAGLDQELKGLDDWVIELAGKRNLVKAWGQFRNDEARRAELYQLINRKWASWQKPIWITGHSLGGALGTLAAYRLLKLGMNVRGLYTFGSPRVGNHAFMHDLRVMAFENGMKVRKGEGNLARFVNHNDVVARIPPVFGWTSAVDDSILNPVLDKWRHVGRARYLTGGEAEQQELWLQGDSQFDDRFAAHPFIDYTIKLPLERWKQWVQDHWPTSYAHKLEKLAFGTQTHCE